MSSISIKRCCCVDLLRCAENSENLLKCLRQHAPRDKHQLRIVSSTRRNNPDHDEKLSEVRRRLSETTAGKEMSRWCDDETVMVTADEPRLVREAIRLHVGGEKEDRL